MKVTIEVTKKEAVELDVEFPVHVRTDYGNSEYGESLSYARFNSPTDVFVIDRRQYNNHKCLEFKIARITDGREADRLLVNHYHQRIAFVEWCAVVVEVRDWLDAAIR